MPEKRRTADADGNGLVDTDELRVYVAAAVEASTAGRQHPVVDRDNRDTIVALPVVP